MAYAQYLVIAGVPAIESALQRLDSQEAEDNGWAHMDDVFETLYCAWGDFIPGFAGELLEKEPKITREMGMTTFYEKMDATEAELSAAQKVYDNLPPYIRELYEAEGVTPGVYTIWFTS